MKIGKYQIGRYNGIIKKFYEDGSFDYETSYTSELDISESIFAIENCIGNVVGIATVNPKILVNIDVIRTKKILLKN